jgi:hypothetical protein
MKTHRNLVVPQLRSKNQTYSNQMFSLVCSQMSRFEELPVEVKRLIYGFDATYIIIYNQVMKELYDSRTQFKEYIKIDRGYSIRNFEIKNWTFTPRYYDKNNDVMRGSYFRRNGHFFTSNYPL